MGLSLEERIVVRVKCGNTEQPHMIEKALAWLIAKDVMACPYCSSLVNLKDNENGPLIQELAESCRRLGVALNSSGNKS